MAMTAGLLTRQMCRAWMLLSGVSRPSSPVPALQAHRGIRPALIDTPVLGALPHPGGAQLACGAQMYISTEEPQ